MDDLFDTVATRYFLSLINMLLSTLSLLCLIVVPHTWFMILYYVAISWMWFILETKHITVK